MDELDQLLTTKQEVVYNFFNWPTLVGSKLIVIAVANTHDLPERVMTGRVRSRLGKAKNCYSIPKRLTNSSIGMTRINYQPYDKAQLIEIVNARLEAAKVGYKGKFPDVIEKDGVNFAAAKVASISGDARRVLDICRSVLGTYGYVRYTILTEYVDELWSLYDQPESPQRSNRFKRSSRECRAASLPPTSAIVVSTSESCSPHSSNAPCVMACLR